MKKVVGWKRRGWWERRNVFWRLSNDLDGLSGLA